LLVPKNGIRAHQLERNAIVVSLEYEAKAQVNVRMSEEGHAVLTQSADKRRSAEYISNWKSEPNLWELFLLVAVGCVLFDVTLSALSGWHTAVINFGDNVAYLQAATAIGNWDFHGIDTQHFLGYPYAIVAVSIALHLPLDLTLSLVATAASPFSLFRFVGA